MKLFTTNTYVVMTFITCIFFSYNAFAVKHVVQVANFQFSPSSLTGIMVGDTIRWEWQSGSHTTTSTSVPTGASTWDAPLNSNDTSFEYRVLVAGSYAYRCTPHGGMGMTGSFTALEIPTGLATIDAKPEEIKFYPNPLGDNIKIALTSNETVPGMLKIYDVKGDLVMQIPFGIREGENLFDLPIAVLDKGMYLFEVSAGKDRMGLQLLAKN